MTLALNRPLVAAGAGVAANAAEAERSERVCDKATLPEIDYYTCEGMRLRTKGMALEAQARAQETRGKMTRAECGRQEEEGAARDCGLISSDLLEDSGFKHAEAEDILNEARRMEERAADLQKNSRFSN